VPNGPLESLQDLDNRIAESDTPQHKMMLTHVRERMCGEMLGDIDQITAAMAPDFVLHLHNSGIGASMTLGVDELRMMVSSAPSTDDSVMWVEWDRMLLGADSIAMNGLMHMQTPGAAAQAIHGADKIDDPEATYLITTRFLTFGIYRDESMVIEESFVDGAASTFEKVEPNRAFSRSQIAASISAPE
jgi:hypothetical protein